jgi:GTP-binding protein HflX
VEKSLEELALLADTAGLIVAGEAVQRLDQPNVSTYIGSGKVDEIKMMAEELDADVILFDDELNPRHQRELEERFGDALKVIDRSALILDIFAQHARTAEGQLQVELAQLEYRLPRLTRMWTHLARQAGGRAGGSTGGVGLRGPGEQQIEVDRREIQRRIKRIQQDLEGVRTRRGQQRAKRRQTALRLVALVGYTNAGKSTLLNRLSGADVLVADKLFATLDPTLRTVSMPGGREMLFTDTVGFIQKLPPGIVAAFRATLEEIEEAHVLVHVVDATHPQALEQMDVVRDTLAELEVDVLPVVIALNKIDMLSDEERDTWANRQLDRPAVLVSAKTGEGMDQLRLTVEAAVEKYLLPIAINLPYKRGDLMSLFYERGQVDDEQHTSEGMIVYGRLPGRLHPYFADYLLDQSTEPAE